MVLLITIVFINPKENKCYRLRVHFFFDFLQKPLSGAAANANDMGTSFCFRSPLQQLIGNMNKAKSTTITVGTMLYSWPGVYYAMAMSSAPHSHGPVLCKIDAIETIQV